LGGRLERPVPQVGGLQSTSVAGTIPVILGSIEQSILVSHLLNLDFTASKDA
jgi:hypothetical protein